MGQPIGRRRWAIAEGYIPGRSTGTGDMLSHEALCVLNAGDGDAHLAVTLFFAESEPAGPYRLEVPARRTRHFRFNDFPRPAIPRDTPYASLIESDVPVVVQHTRLDSRQAELALMSTIAYGEA